MEDGYELDISQDLTLNAHKFHKLQKSCYPIRIKLFNKISLQWTGDLRSFVGCFSR